MRGRKRPMDERARAVGIAVVAGGAEASRQTGIPERTIQQWTESAEFAELRERTKDQVAGEWWAGVQSVARSVLRDAEQAAPKDRAVIFAILFDKLALIRGEVTERYETRDLTKAFDDHELAAIRRVVELAPTINEAEAAVVGAGPEGTAST